MSVLRLRCPQCRTAEPEDFQVFTSTWLAWPTLEPVPNIERPAPLDEDTVECVAHYDDEETPCGYRAPFHDFVLCGRGEDVPVRDYSATHGGDPPKSLNETDEDEEEEEEENNEEETDEDDEVEDDEDPDDD